MAETNVTQKPETNELIIERVFDAPRERVWQAFTDPAQLAAWWGPRGWETEIKEFSFEPGGRWHYVMRCVDEGQGEFYGQESWGLGIYEEINQPDGFKYRDYFSDAEGVVNDAMPGTGVVMEFIEEDGKTRLISRSTFDSAEAYQTVIDMGVVEGITETWDRLAEAVER